MMFQVLPELELLMLVNFKHTFAERRSIKEVSSEMQKTKRAIANNGHRYFCASKEDSSYRTRVIIAS